MKMTLQEMKELPAGSFQLADLRSEEEKAHGKIPDALETDAERILCDADLPDPGKKLILICGRGRDGNETAEKLCEKGLDAVSLEGGYAAWLLDTLGSKADGALADRAEKSIQKKYRRELWSSFTKAIRTYELVKPGDRIAVCISGGKDSMLMAKLFQELKLHNKFEFDIRFLVMDPGYSPENRKIIEENARLLNIPVRIFESRIFDSVFHIEKSPCYICARMRRGYLYRFAKEMGCNKIALGHHYDDVIETILMGMMYAGQFQTMMPKLHSTNFPGMELIRPMYLIREDDIKAWRDYNGLHFLQCACKFTEACTLADTEENLSKRLEVKRLIRTLSEQNPYLESNLFRSAENVSLDRVIGYKQNGTYRSFLDNYDEEGLQEEDGAG